MNSNGLSPQTPPTDTIKSRYIYSGVESKLAGTMLVFRHLKAKHIKREVALHKAIVYYENDILRMKARDINNDHKIYYFHNVCCIPKQFFDHMFFPSSMMHLPQ